MTVRKLKKKMAAWCMKHSLMVTEPEENYFDSHESQPSHNLSHPQILDYANSSESQDNDKQISDNEDSSKSPDFEASNNEWVNGNPNHQPEGSDQDDVLINHKECRQKIAAKKKKDVKKHDQHKFGRVRTRRECPSSERISQSQLDNSVIDLSIATQGYIESLEQQGKTQLPTQEAYRRYFRGRNIFEEYAPVIHNDIFQLPIADRFISWNALTAWVRAKSDSDEKLNDFNIRRFVSYIFAKLSFVKPDENTSNAKHYLIAAS